MPGLWKPTLTPLAKQGLGDMLLEQTGSVRLPVEIAVHFCAILWSCMCTSISLCGYVSIAIQLKPIKLCKLKL